MHGTRGEWSDANSVVHARVAPRANVSLLVTVFVLGLGVLAGIAVLAAVAMPAWAKFAILFAILAPAGSLGWAVLQRRGALAGAPSEGRSRLLRRAADAVDEPRAVLGPAGETVHANAAFIALFKKSAGAGGDPVAG